MTDVAELKAGVQTNCHISDALYAREYSLCIYLLKMREFYRWEKGYGYTDRLPNDDLGRWLVDREQLWEGLEELEFQPLQWEGRTFGPFESSDINAALVPNGLVYSGGYGHAAKPHFFLADLEREETFDGNTVLVSGREYARDISAPPAMLQENTIYVRKESLRRMLWEKLEEWELRKQENPMARAARDYDFADDFERALDRMTEAETEAVILHEVGEHQAGKLLGPEWERMLQALAGTTRPEFFARAVRDHLADCAVTLPALMERDATSSLHFYLANLSGIRKALFPELVEAYDNWCESGRLGRLRKAVVEGRARWQAVAEEMLACYQKDDADGCYKGLMERFGI